MLVNDRQVSFNEGVMQDQLIFGVGHCEQVVTLGGGQNAESLCCSTSK